MKVNRELIIELSTWLTANINTSFATANAAVAKTPVRFCHCRLTARGNLFLTTIPSVLASAAEE